MTPAIGIRRPLPEADHGFIEAENGANAASARQCSVKLATLPILHAAVEVATGKIYQFERPSN